MPPTIGTSMVILMYPVAFLATVTLIISSSMNTMSVPFAEIVVLLLNIVKLVLFNAYS